MELKEIANKLNTTVSDLYKKMNTTQQKISYQKKSNTENYNNLITAGIVNHFKISHSELIKVLELYQLQKEKLQD